MNEFRAMNKYVGSRAAKYDEKREHKAATQRDQEIVEAYIAGLDLGASILDMPAGTGRFIAPCVSHGLIYTGVDISADMLEIARSKIPEGVTNVELRVADARSLPYPDDAFDYAIVVKFIKWLPTTEILAEVLAELRRVVRKEAFVQITVSEEETTLLDRLRLASAWLPFGGQPVVNSAGDDNEEGGSRSFSEKELRKVFSVAGLFVRDVVVTPQKKKKRANRTKRLFYILAKDSDFRSAAGARN